MTPAQCSAAGREHDLEATVVDTEYGGRHLDVVLDANGTRLFARIPSGESDSWERTLKVDDAVRASFYQRNAHFFDESSGVDVGGRRSGNERFRVMSTALADVRAPSTRPFPVRTVANWAGVCAFLGAVSYLVILPLVRLQMKALADGARGYRIAYTDPAFGKTLGYTIGLAFGSLAIALVLGTLLAWAATRLPRRLRILRVLPIFPIIVPAVASVVGWSFLFSPRPGLPQCAAAQPAVVVGPP